MTKGAEAGSPQLAPGTASRSYSVFLNAPPPFLSRWTVVGSTRDGLEYAILAPESSARISADRLRLVVRCRSEGLTVETVRAITLPLCEKHDRTLQAALGDRALTGAFRERRGRLAEALAEAGVPVFHVKRFINLYRQGEVRAAVMNLQAADGREGLAVRFASDDPGALRRLIDCAGFATHADTPVEAWLAAAADATPLAATRAA